LNKVEGEEEFPRLGKTNFFAITLTKIKASGSQANKGI
jgi:hypothetical protein